MLEECNTPEHLTKKLLMIRDFPSDSFECIAMNSKANGSKTDRIDIFILIFRVSLTTLNKIRNCVYDDSNRMTTVSIRSGRERNRFNNM